LSTAAKRAAASGLICLSMLSFPWVLVFAVDHGGKDNVFASMFIGVGSFLLAGMIGLMSVIMCLWASSEAIASPNPRDRNAARVGLGALGLSLLIVLWALKR
jgi:hypothetical protein